MPPAVAINGKPTPAGQAADPLATDAAPGSLLHQLVFLCEDERANFCGKGHEIVVLVETIPVITTLGVVGKTGRLRLGPEG